MATACIRSMTMHQCTARLIDETTRCDAGMHALSSRFCPVHVRECDASYRDYKALAVRAKQVQSDAVLMNRQFTALVALHEVDAAIENTEIYRCVVQEEAEGRAAHARRFFADDVSERQEGHSRRIEVLIERVNTCARFLDQLRKRKTNLERAGAFAAERAQSKAAVHRHVRKPKKQRIRNQEERNQRAAEMPCQSREAWESALWVHRRNEKARQVEERSRRELEEYQRHQAEHLRMIEEQRRLKTQQQRSYHSEQAWREYLTADATERRLQDEWLRITQQEQRLISIEQQRQEYYRIQEQNRLDRWIRRDALLAQDSSGPTAGQIFLVICAIWLLYLVAPPLNGMDAAFAPLTATSPTSDGNSGAMGDVVEHRATESQVQVHGEVHPVPNDDTILQQWTPDQALKEAADWIRSGLTLVDGTFQEIGKDVPEIGDAVRSAIDDVQQFAGTAVEEAGECRNFLYSIRRHTDGNHFQNPPDGPWREVRGQKVPSG